MPRVDLIQTNMTSGELSPAIARGRMDIAKYQNGLARAENVILTIQGGAKRRPGSLYLAPTKNTTNQARLIEFIYNRGQAYVIEAGEGYMRIIRDRALIQIGGAPYVLPSPFTYAQAQVVNYVQKSDTAFFVHEAVVPYRMQRFADIKWTLLNAPFINPPVEELGHYPAAALALSAVSGVITIAASAAAFLPGDVGRDITYYGGAATITGFTDTSHVTAIVSSAFDSTSIAASVWNLTGSPQASIIPTRSTNVGDPVAVSNSFTATGPGVHIDASNNDVVGYTTLHAVAHGRVTGDAVRISDATVSSAKTEVDAIDGYYVVQVLDADNLRIPYTGTLPDSATLTPLVPSGNTGLFRPEDIGKVISVNGGSITITSVTSTSVVNGTVLKGLSSSTAASANSWTLSGYVWNVRDGYPRAVTINKQRLMFAGSPGFPQTVWFSSIQGYLDFAFGVEADEAFRFELDGARNSPIRHVSPARQLLVLTDSDEMSISGGTDTGITPTNVDKDDQTSVGSSSVRPVKVGNELLVVQQPGMRIYALSYQFNIDGFSAADRTVFATHITGPGVTELGYRKHIDQQVFAVRSDGVLAVCAYDIDQEVTGWSRWTTQGAYESTCTIPTDTGEDTYAVVARTVGGVVNRYIEVFDPAMMVDCGIAGTSTVSGGQTTWSGLSHLEGLTVAVYADGASLGTFVVSGGQVTLPRPAVYVQIGLPFTPLIEPLQIEVGTGSGSAVGKPIATCEVLLRVLDTGGCQINGVPFEFRQTDTAATLDLPPPVMSGDVRDSGLLSADLYRTTLVITQNEPLPFHLIDIVRRVTVNA